MSEDKIEKEWIWIIVQNPGDDESYLGLQETENEPAFIPVFESKASAEKGLALLKQDQLPVFEIQAVEINDMATQAAENDFLLYLVDDTGTVKGQILPDD